VKTIVVGVDGSVCSLAAAEFAAQEAAFREARLLVVAAWDLPPNALLIEGAVPGFLDRFREDAESVAQDAVSRVTGLHPHVTCQTRVVQGHPGRVLVEEAQEAILVVVGNRGRGGFASLVLGSVSQQVVLHAPCSVVVVRAEPEASGGGSD
jgi:nucleotide-binding universal stress UspA family protein